MRYYLLVYRRSAGRLEDCQDLGPDRESALKLRFERERRESADRDVEVVLLGAPSLEALKSTHSRYFKTVSELAADLDATLPRP